MAAAALTLGCGARTVEAVDGKVDAVTADVAMDSAASDVTEIEAFAPDEVAVVGAPPPDALPEAGVCATRALVTCERAEDESLATALDRAAARMVRECAAKVWACGDLWIWFAEGCATALASDRENKPAFTECVKSRLAAERWSCGEGVARVMIGSCTIK